MQINIDSDDSTFHFIVAESVQTVTYLVLSVSGLTAPHALKVVPVWQVNVVA